MATFSLSWDVVAGSEGYDVHSGPDSGLPIDMQDVGNPTPVGGKVSATVTVTLWSGAGYAQVCGYVTVDGVKVEGPRTSPVAVTAADSLAPGGSITAGVR